MEKFNSDLTVKYNIIVTVISKIRLFLSLPKKSIELINILPGHIIFHGFYFYFGKKKNNSDILWVHIKKSILNTKKEGSGNEKLYNMFFILILIWLDIPFFT